MLRIYVFTSRYQIFPEKFCVKLYKKSHTKNFHFESINSFIQSNQKKCLLIGSEFSCYEQKIHLGKKELVISTWSLV